MPYTTGSQGAQANCAKYFMENALHTALTAVYTYVEEYVNGAVVCRVYKSIGASNSFGQDWFLIVRRATDAATTVSLGVTEQYNSSTHLCFNYAPSATSGLTPTAQFAINDAGGQLASSTTIETQMILTISTAGFQYWLSVTPNRVISGTRVSTNDYFNYSGLYQDFLTTSISPFPLFTGGVTPGSYYGSYTREPNTLTSNTYNFHLYSPGALAAFSPYTLTFQSELYTGKHWLSRVLLGGRATSPPLTVRGLLYDVWAADASVTSSAVNGDTLSATVDGVAKTLVYLRSSGTNARMLVDVAL